MGVAGALGFGFINGFGSASASSWARRRSRRSSPTALSVVPLFILMGVFAAHAGLSRSLYRRVLRLRRPLPRRARDGDGRRLRRVRRRSAARPSRPPPRCAAWRCPRCAGTAMTIGWRPASIAAGGTLGVLIPPSIILVIYGLLTETSIGTLFIAGVLPGLLGYRCSTWLQSRRHRRGSTRRSGRPAPASPGRQRWRAVRRVWDVALLFAAVIGGIYLGWFSPTEAAAVGAFGAFLFALLRRALSRGQLVECLSRDGCDHRHDLPDPDRRLVFNYFIETAGLPQLLVRLGPGRSAGTATWSCSLMMAFYVVLGLLHREPVDDPPDRPVRLPADRRRWASIRCGSASCWSPSSRSA